MAIRDCPVVHGLTGLQEEVDCCCDHPSERRWWFRSDGREVDVFGMYFGSRLMGLADVCDLADEERVDHIRPTDMLFAEV